jgi:hypothetical protein
MKIRKIRLLSKRLIESFFLKYIQKNDFVTLNHKDLNANLTVKHIFITS